MPPTAAVTEPPAAARLPVAPTACKVATSEPTATPPPFATAADDIIEAATEPAAMPPVVKPAAATARGAATTATTPVPSPMARGTTQLYKTKYTDLAVCMRVDAAKYIQLNRRQCPYMSSFIILLCLMPNYSKIG
jgi:hypothetical protein